MLEFKPHQDVCHAVMKKLVTSIKGDSVTTFLSSG